MTQTISKNKSRAIECPECGTEIEISKVLSSQLEKDLRKSLQQENESKLKLAVTKAEQNALKKTALELQDLENRLAEREKESLRLRKQTRELEAQQEGIEDEIAKRVKESEKSLKAILSDKIKADLAKEKEAEMLDLQSRIDNKDKNLLKAQEIELTLRKQTRELEDKQKELDITLERKLDEGRKEIVEKYHAESDLKLKEKEKLIASLRKSLEDAKRKSEQGSQETQGEALELDLEQKLRQQFAQDDIRTVAKGVKGADIIQTVSDNQMQPCGKILWEAKNTKNWAQGWIQKLKDDQMASGANISILVSTVLPDGVSSFAQLDGVWVCSVANALPLVSALREQLIQLNFARLAAAGKDQKMEMMFQYITGDEFRQRIETIVSAFDKMQMQINRERRAMEKQWRERETQINRIMLNTSGMHGDIKGIFGNSVQDIKALELDDDSDLFEDLSDN